MGTVETISSHWGVFPQPLSILRQPAYIGTPILYPMQKATLYSAVLLLLLGAGCAKESLPENLSTPPEIPPATIGFVEYLIPKGSHYSTTNSYKPVDCTAMKFTVRFDSSCIYQSVKAENQWDINKLYGFADNGALHHQFSARFGWRWSEGALRLFAYTYNNGSRASKELATVPVGQNIRCAIAVDGDKYLFSVGEISVAMPRHSTTPAAKGYQLYPYFGGDEVAPHNVRIWIREEK